MKKVFIIILLVATFICLSACCPSRTVTMEKPVYIPTKCDVVPPTRPHSDVIDAHYLKRVLMYTDFLECDLHFCVTGEVKSECADKTNTGKIQVNVNIK